jgi:triosephosphate isomerase
MTSAVLVGTSTKMNLTSTEARAYLLELRRLVGNVREVDIFVLPPFTSLWVARESLTGTRIGWGAQDVHPQDAGAHTGDVSAPMLVDLGCSWVEVGHSERRGDHGETDRLIAAKVAQILRHGMTPILCVGEAIQVGVAEAVAAIRSQLQDGLALVARHDLARVVVAYEPVWAIGEGSRNAPPDHIAAIHAQITSLLRELGAAGARVIYGGSVDPGNASGILATPHVDGLFVGRAALLPATFAEIVGAAVEAARSSPG